MYKIKSGSTTWLSAAVVVWFSLYSLLPFHLSSPSLPAQHYLTAHSSLSTTSISMCLAPLTVMLIPIFLHSHSFFKTRFARMSLLFFLFKKKFFFKNVSSLIELLPLYNSPHILHLYASVLDHNMSILSVEHTS